MYSSNKVYIYIAHDRMWPWEVIQFRYTIVECARYVRFPVNM